VIHAGTIQNVVFSPDGKRLASVSEDDTLRLWDVETGQEMLTIKGARVSVAFSRDGKRLAACTGNNSVTVWEAP
jgi:WD40 repeat protein